MHRMNARFVLMCCTALTVGHGLAGCPSGECQARLDCPAGKICSSDHVCVTDPGPVGEGEGDGDAGIPHEGEGESDAGQALPEVTIQLIAPPTMMVPDPSAARRALIATAGPGEDRLTSFDIDDTLSAPPSDVEADFLLQGSSPNSCALDTLAVFDSTFLDLPEDELWYSCTDPAKVRIQYPDSDPQLNQLYDDNGIAALEVFFAWPNEDDPNIVGRIAYAPRNGSFKVIQLGQSDQARVARLRDTTTDLGLDYVAGIFPVVLNDSVLGDILLVYDRGNGGSDQQLVPVQRLPQATTWSTTLSRASTSFVPLALPEDTHFALFNSAVGIRDAQTFTMLEEDNDRANVLVLLPTLGEVRFLRYENEAVTPGGSGFRTLYVGGARPTSLPPPTDRVLLAPLTAGGQTFLFYAMTHQAFAWRLPVHENRTVDRTNEVIATVTEIATERYSGMVVIDAVDAWFAGQDGGLSFLRRMAFSQGGL